MIFPHRKIFYLGTVFLITCCSCNNSNTAEEQEIETKTPVTVSGISKEKLAETIELSATSIFRIKDNVKANISGYIQEVHAKLGDFVKKGQLLFTLKTKEASALSINSVDTAFNFPGIIKIYSPLSGVITTLEKQNGDYVQEGDDIAIVADQGSLVFILEVPFEWKKYVKVGASCNILLPGNEEITGLINSEMPTVDAEAQTQNYIVRPVTSSTLPENLIAKVEIIKNVKHDAQTLPKAAVLTDETQSEWWVMKLINDSLAVKIPVTKGIETSDKVEIVEPVFTDADRIILTGNYGLPDTAKVSIMKK